MQTLQKGKGDKLSPIEILISSPHVVQRAVDFFIIKVQQNNGRKIKEITDKNIRRLVHYRRVRIHYYAILRLFA